MWLFIEPCFGIGHNLSLICQMTSEDIKQQLIINEDGYTLYNCDYAMRQRKRRNTGLVPVLKCALGRQMTTVFRAEPIDDPLTE